ncbi:glycosyltransferase [Marinobacter sp. CHS3-4]|uniref:glycosyltransferase n=1 Tax=Marinobacter sp. CHS3-4 TaxID=3045174 RepID=UPI0024B4B299|nr:glycosyltransferase [Marinobacter sp. CHS3-4]MDI9244967.1 glycosyltransferase [Marinobacter sp. CHS3-4]
MTVPLASSEPFASVIIPCFNAASMIDRLLESLQAQSLDKSRFEVICIDNGSSDETLEVLEKLRQRLSIDLKIGEESGVVGSYAARNKGIGLSSGDVLFFTDADCVADSVWLEHGIRALLEFGRNTICGGAVELFSSSPDSPSAVEMFEMILGFSQRRNVEENGYSVTANLMCWRECLSEVGLFNSQLRSKGDFEWCSRAKEKQYVFSYVGSAMVFHPARRTLGSIVTKTRRVTGGQRDIKKLDGNNTRLGRSGRSLTAQLRLVLSDRRFPKLRQKVAVLNVACLVYVVKTFEKLRLYLGARSERR